MAGSSHPSYTYTELIDSFLRPRVVNGEKVGEFIHEADAYAAGPDQLTGSSCPRPQPMGRRRGTSSRR
ncbi:hypothetical protein C2845_PM07G18680 [Panicum miliaceum]|uniref:Uncharacterized protein n=1 Tax=Panicum miliaceum TaxID=4540 RepID=A0A3L6SLX1_PANMI|nr:hypothetical protein C2845_PM07G18680 [Panicum miliaceum]